VRIVDGGKITLDGFDAAHKLEMTLDNVIGDTPGDLKISGAHATLRMGPGPVNLQPSGDDVTVIGRPPGAIGSATPNSCQNKFVPFPGR
jgi:hypothetical protein